MKNHVLKVSASIIFVLIGITVISAQNAKIIKMKMAEMESSPEHVMTEAYRMNVLTFAAALRDMTKDGNPASIESARKMLAEIKRSMEKMEESHILHMQTMTAEMNEIMFSTMEKMYAENKLIKEHIAEIETAIKSSTPNQSEISKHAAYIVNVLGNKKNRKMKM